MTAKPEAAPAIPNGVHITIVVYGPLYTRLFIEVGLRNLVALVPEIPEFLRAKSLVRIVTTEHDHAVLRKSPMLGELQKQIRVDVLEKVSMGDERRHGGYAPMVATQRLVVIEAARDNAAIIFFGPDTLCSRGSFAFLIDRLCMGYRLIVGPSLRIKRDASLPYIREQIRAGGNGAFALEPEDQCDLFFRYFHPSMDEFVLESENSIQWKAYVFHRPRERELLIRFLQGPTLAAWPSRRADDFDGFIDHELPELCCDTWRQMYVVEDARDYLALDLTKDDLPSGHQPSVFPRTDLLRSLFDTKNIRTLKLLYGLRTCRVHGSVRSSATDVQKWERTFADTVDPLMLVALVQRNLPAVFFLRTLYKYLCIWNTNTIIFILRYAARTLLRPYKQQAPVSR